MASDAEPPASLTSVHVRRAVQGDQGSVAWLVARLTPLLIAAAAHRMGPTLRAHHDPEDLVHDAWLVTLPRFGDLVAGDGRHTPVLLRFLTTTLVYRISNLARRHLRGGASPGAAGAAGSDLAQVAGPQTSVVAAAIRGEAQSLVRSCIDELPEADRQILILRGIEQLPNHTVAAVLGVTPQAVAMRFRRALARLRERLPGSVFDELSED